MTECCKNCKHSHSYKGAGGGKAYFCQKQPISKKEQVGMGAKYVRVKPNIRCSKYESRVKENETI